MVSHFWRTVMQAVRSDRFRMTNGGSPHAAEPTSHAGTATVVKSASRDLDPFEYGHVMKNSCKQHGRRLFNVLGGRQTKRGCRDYSAKLVPCILKCVHSPARWGQNLDHNFPQNGEFPGICRKLVRIFDENPSVILQTSSFVHLTCFQNKLYHT